MDSPVLESVQCLESSITSAPTSNDSPPQKRRKAKNTESTDDKEPERLEEVEDGMGKEKGRRKIRIEYIDDKSKRQITFSKRKSGLMKKAYELTTLTGTQALLLVASETGHVYTFATPQLQPFVTLPEGKSLIQQCLNAPDASGFSNVEVDEEQES